MQQLRAHRVLMAVSTSLTKWNAPINVVVYSI